MAASGTTLMLPRLRGSWDLGLASIFLLPHRNESHLQTITYKEKQDCNIKLFLTKKKKIKALFEGHHKPNNRVCARSVVASLFCAFATQLSLIVFFVSLLQSVVKGLVSCWGKIHVTVGCSGVQFLVRHQRGKQGSRDLSWHSELSQLKQIINTNKHTDPVSVNMNRMEKTKYHPIHSKCRGITLPTAAPAHMWLLRFKLMTTQ